MSEYLRIRIPGELKADVEALFCDMGMAISEAVLVFIPQSVNFGGLQFA